MEIPRNKDGELELTVTVSLDGDKWCALAGENLQEGVAGFGDTPSAALLALVEEMKKTQT